MNINMTGTTLDIILFVVLILSIFVGWKNGLIDSLLRLILDIIVLGVSWFVSKPLSLFIPLPEMPIEAELLTFVTPLLQRAMAFIIVFIILIIAKSIIYILLKPIIFKIIEFFKIVDVVDSVCGALFNIVKNIIIASLVIACLNLPIITNGSTILSESKGAQIVLKLAPGLSEQLLEFGKYIVDFTKVEEWSNRDFDAKDMISLLDTMNRFEVLTSDNLSVFYNDYQYQIAQIPNATLTIEEYEKLSEMIEDLPNHDALKDTLKNKLTY